MIRITCTNCQKPLSLDESKLPMREVSFPCPACKTKLSVDRRELEGVAPADDDNEDEFGAKALLVGKDDPALRQAAKLVGFLPVHHADPAKAREYYMAELPQLVILNPPQVTAPPLDSMAAIIGLAPADRRRAFLVLVADNLRTFDGNAAFLYGVNLVVATKDMPQFPQIYRDACAAHERLYGSMNAAVRERQSVP